MRMRNRLLNTLIIVSLLSSVSGCTKEAEREFARVRTHEVTDLNEEGVTLVAEILNYGDYEIAECGFALFLGNPSSLHYIGSLNGTIDPRSGFFKSRPVTGMTQGEKYYYYAFVISGGKITTGNLVQFISKGSKPVQIVSFLPVQGHVLDTIRLQFSNLLGGLSGLSVTFNDHKAEIVDFEDEFLRVLVPAELTDEESSIKVVSGGDVHIFQSKYNLLKPEITSFFPVAAAPGDTITISGSNFHRQKLFNTIRFNSFETSVVSSTPSQIKAIVPLLEGMVCQLAVVTSGQEGKATGTLSITGTPVTWKSVSDFPGGNMFKMSSFVIGYNGYVGFGTKIQHAYNSLFWKYNPFTGTWQQIASCPGRTRVEAFGFTINGKGYTGGGFTLDSPDRASLKDFYEYDPLFDRWLALKDFPGKLDKSFTGTSQVVNGKAYMAFTDDELYSYDPALKLWKRHTLPSGVTMNSLAASFAKDGKIYLICGRNKEGNATSEVWSYNTVDGNWVRMSDFPGEPRAGATGFALNGKGFFGLGINGSTLYKDIWSYDDVSDTWTAVDEFPGSARTSVLTMIISDLAFIGTGYVGPNLLARDIYRFNPYTLK